jgi:predicted RNase H-like nuclease
MTQLPARRGPELPYSLVAGVTPCATGWLVATAKMHGATFAPEDPRVIETFVDVLDQRPAFTTIAVNGPIGYLGKFEPRGRACDQEARALLGRRGAAVQSAPVWSQVEEEEEEEEEAHGSLVGLGAVSRKLLPRYRELAVEMAPYRQRTVYEVHPELSFYQLHDDIPMRYSKRSERGREERRALLVKKIPGAERILDARLARVPYSHLLDVAALMWTARRIFAKASVRVPRDPQWDENGLRMEIMR